MLPCVQTLKQRCVRVIPSRKKIVREAFVGDLPESVLWRQKEQFSDGVGYNWIDTLKKITSDQVSDEQMAHAAERFPINPPQNKVLYYYRTPFAEHFPVTVLPIAYQRIL